MWCYVCCCCDLILGDEESIEDKLCLNGIISMSSVGGNLNGGLKVLEFVIFWVELLGLQNESSKVLDLVVVLNLNVEEVVLDMSLVIVKDQKFWLQIDWVIGLDFGIMYLGFVYKRIVLDDFQINVYYDWLWK